MNGKALWVLTAILAIGAGVLGYMGIQLTAAHEQPATEASPSPTRVPGGVSTIVARRFIDAHRAIQAEDLAEIEVPVRNEGAYQASGALIGKIPRVSIPAGEIIKEVHFQSGSAIAQMLTPGTRALAIKVTEVVGSGGYVQPGDFVDVVLYLRNDNGEVKRSISRTLIRQVQVLAYGKSLATTQDGRISHSNEENAQADAASRSVVLAVPRDSVETLMLADNAGTIRLAVVPEQEVESGEKTEGRTDRKVVIRDLTASPKAISRAYGVDVYRGGKRTTEYVAR